MHDQADSSKPDFHGKPYVGNTLGQSRHRKKVGDELTGFPPSHLVPKKSSRSVTATLRLDSNILLHEDSSPESPKKKGREKRKLYRRGTLKKLNLASENTCLENAYSASPLEVLPADSLADKLSETTFSARLLIKDAHLGKDGTENNDYVEHDTTLNVSMLGTDEMDGSECTGSSNDATGESRRWVTYLNNGLNTVHASEFNVSTLAKPDLGEESSTYQKLFCACVCNVDTADTIFSRSTNDNGEKFHVNIGTRSTGLNRMGCHSIGSHSNDTHAENINGYFSGSSCCSKDVTDSSGHIERVQCSSEACSSNTSLRFNSDRSSRKSRKTPSYSDLTMSNRVVIANRHKNGGKDCSAVWQKVEKGDQNVSRGGHADDSPFQDKNAQDTSKGSQQDTTRHRAKRKKNKKAHKRELLNFEMKSTKEEPDPFNSIQPSSKLVSNKEVTFLHHQKGLSFKQGSQSLKKHYAPKNGIPKVTKDYCHQEDLPLQLVQVTDTGDGSTLRSCSADEVILTALNRNCKTEGKDSLQSGNEKTILSNCSFVPDLAPQATSWSSKNLYIDPCASQREEGRCVKLTLENNPQESCKFYSPLGHFSQKWVPIGNKEVSDVIHVDVSEISVVEGSVPADNIHDSVGHASTTTEDIKLASELDSKLNSYDHVSLKCPTYRGTETSYNKITEAINDVYIARQKVEDVQLRIGRPLADCERFMYSASPVLPCTSCPTGCKSYLQECTKNGLCLHQTSDITLGTVWQWYEEPGCYGLEVKAQDFHRSKCLWNSQFTTYFVPYLSAIQLFHRSHRLSGGSIDKEAVDMDMTCETSPHLNPPPIFAKLIPQELKPRNISSTLQTKGDLRSSSAELIFEYFESEQPYSRRQLFEKVNELIAGVKPLNCHISGDPKNLELSLHDLHPTSWYCVAWYPIYRIPDGKLQAAFLTYHSLGHWIHQSSSACQAGQTLVAVPVIGLQSYNAKAEWWYQMSKSDSEDLQLAESRAGEASHILKERLRTLNEAAGLMSRAEVLKNDQLSRNRHPDYEFFLSRS